MFKCLSRHVFIQCLLCNEALLQLHCMPLIMRIKMQFKDDRKNILLYIILALPPLYLSFQNRLI